MTGSRTLPRYAVALYRVSMAEQGHSGLGLEAQQASVRAIVDREDWTLVTEHQDIASGEDDRRPGFQAALRRSAATPPRQHWTATRGVGMTIGAAGRAPGP
jgi:hypothetical protein